MAESSVFRNEVEYRSPDTRPQPDVAVYYDGSTNVVPTIVAGNIVFAGARANRPAMGIGGLAATGGGVDYKLKFADILTGGAGVKLRCCELATKQKLRFGATAGPGDISLRLEPIDDAENPYEYTWEIPLFVYYREGEIDTVEQKLNALKAEFDRTYSHFGTARVVEGIGNEKFIEIETKYAGRRFRVETSTNLTGPFVITPGFKGAYQTDMIVEWFGDKALPAQCAEPATCLKAIDLTAEVTFPGGGPGGATSNAAQALKVATKTNQSISVLFANNVNGEAARVALLAILNVDGDPYKDRVLTTECEDKVVYSYTIERTDTATQANILSVKNDYSAQDVSRIGRNGGKSIYVVTVNSTTAPTASGTDTVVRNQ